MAAYTIETWLRGKVDFDFTSEAIAAILYDRGIAGGTALSEVSEKDRDLCYADLLMYAASSSVRSSGEYISDNGYQMQKASRNVYDRKTMRDNALRIYKKWDDSKAETVSGAGFKMKNLY